MNEYYNCTDKDGNPVTPTPCPPQQPCCCPPDYTEIMKYEQRFTNIELQLADIHVYHKNYIEGVIAVKLTEIDKHAEVFNNQNIRLHSMSMAIKELDTKVDALSANGGTGGGGTGEYVETINYHTGTLLNKFDNRKQDVINLTAINTISPKQFGVSPENPDNTEALQQCLTFAVMNNAVIRDYSGDTYTFLSDIAVNATDGSHIVRTLRVEGNFTLTSPSSTITLMGANMPIGGVSASLEGYRNVNLQSQLDTPLYAGTRVLVVSGTDYSFAGYQPQYRIGEVVTLREVAIGNTLYTQNPLNHSYPSTQCTAYAYTPLKVFIAAGIKLLSGASKVLQLFYCADSEIHCSTHSYSDSSQAMASLQCYMCINTKVYGSHINNSILAGTTGVQITSCEKVDLFLTEAYGYAHAVLVDSDPYKLAIPNREVVIHSGTLTSHASSETPTVKFDGHLVGGRIHSTVVYGSICYGGIDCTSDNNTIYAKSAINRPLFLLGEMVGGRIGSDNDNIKNSGAATCIMDYLNGGSSEHHVLDTAIMLDNLTVQGNYSLNYAMITKTRAARCAYSVNQLLVIGERSNFAHVMSVDYNMAIVDALSYSVVNPRFPTNGCTPFNEYIKNAQNSCIQGFYHSLIKDNAFVEYFADGTVKVSAKVLSLKVVSNQQYDGSAVFDALPKKWDFPLQFIQPPDVVFTPNKGFVVGCVYASKTTTSVELIMLMGKGGTYTISGNLTITGRYFLSN